MGKYFVMSTRFDKCTAEDFGLIPNGQDTATDPVDGGVWERGALYDFGWGRENGYYKMPLPGFDVLIDLALHSSDRDDAYGAAAVVMDRYAEELLACCEALAKDRDRRGDFIRAAEVFGLGQAVNRCSVLNKSDAEIREDHRRWKELAEAAKAAEFWKG